MGLFSLRSVTHFWCLAGLGLCAYALFVEHNLAENPEYEPLCNINENIKCSDVLTSEYGKGLGLLQKVLDADHWLIQPNPIYGLVNYSLIFLLACFTSVKLVAKLQLYVCLLCNLGSIYLGYILYFVLKDFCVVCIATYFVNFVLLICSFIKSRGIRNVRQHDSFTDSKRHSGFSLPTQTRPNDFKKNI